ncbi:hypothetical protein N9917_00590 [Deltaproteobacteria bacterium]|nr:hypothetical protein [Deltaproteobacteria bacterium]
MGIRDHLADYGVPYDNAVGYKKGEVVLTSEDCNGFGFLIPKGSEVVIDSFPEARHGADMYDLGSVNYTDPKTGEVHKYLEWALSIETADHHFGGDVAGVHRPGEEPKRINRLGFTIHECPEGTSDLRERAEVKKGRDRDSIPEYPWSVFFNNAAVFVVYCPFCGEKLPE